MPSETQHYDIPRARLERERVVRERVGDAEIVAAATPDGIRVYSGICPHLGGPLLEADLRDGVIRCPWHHYEFDLASGACLTPPGLPWNSMVGREPSREPFRIKLIPLRFEVADERIRVFLRKT